MKSFEEGKTYYVNGPGQILVEKVTEHFITFSGDFSGRKKIYKDNLFGLGENILIDHPTCRQLKYFCFAGHEVE